MIPFPPCLVFGAGHIRRGSGATWTRGRAADKEKKRKHFRHKALSSSLSCLSLTFVCLGFIILLINVPVRALGSARGAFSASVTCWGGLFPVLFRMWLAFEEKRKWNWWNVFLCSSRMQGSLPITFDWSLALVMCHLGKLSRLLATPASQGCVSQKLLFPYISGSHKSCYFSLKSFLASSACCDLKHSCWYTKCCNFICSCI